MIRGGSVKLQEPLYSAGTFPTLDDVRVQVWSAV